MASEQLPKFSRYEIVGVLGHGSMGAVYKANHKLLDRSVALKVPRRDMLKNPTSVERFLREGKALAMLQHPNVVSIFDADIENDLPYIAMEYIEGGTLRSRIINSDGLPVPIVQRWAVELANALDYIHEKNILHRDLKSTNILITEDNKALLTDFGIASIEVMATITTGLLGTPAYMSPEQARGEDLDGRSDIYSLGVVLYEALTGTVPFYQENGLAILQQIINDDPRPIQELRPDTPVWLDRVVMQCLEKKPAMRFETGKVLIQAIDKGARERSKEEAGIGGRSALGTMPGMFSRILYNWHNIMGPAVHSMKVHRTATIYIAATVAFLMIFILLRGFFSHTELNMPAAVEDSTSVEGSHESVEVDSTGGQLESLVINSFSYLP